MSADGGHGALVRLARLLARVAVPRSLWPVVDQELQDELSTLRTRGWCRVARGNVGSRPVSLGRRKDWRGSCRCEGRAEPDRPRGDGKRLERGLQAGGSSPALEVVGVAADVRHQGLGTAVAPTVYLPASQSRPETHEFVLRIRGDVGTAVQSARELVAALSPTTPVVIILDTEIARSVAIPRFRTVLVVGLAALAAGLALLGVYGVVSFAVAQRTKEIGMRRALGARSASVVFQVVARGLGVGIAGVALGLLLAWGLSDGVGAFLYGITPTDPMTYAGVAVGLLLVSAAAALVPAIRAANVDPVTVLKAD